MEPEEPTEEVGRKTPSQAIFLSGLSIGIALTATAFGELRLAGFASVMTIIAVLLAVKRRDSIAT